MSILERPWYVNVKVTAEAEEKIELFARSEFFVLPPDAPKRRAGEDFNEWFERVYSETKYVGYKTNQTGVGIYSNEGTANFMKEIIDSGVFYDIKDSGTVSLPFLLMHSVEWEDGRFWYINQKCDYPVIIIKWYTENHEINPDAVPETCEYVYIKWENSIIEK